jgi:hypothetical protein
MTLTVMIIASVAFLIDAYNPNYKPKMPVMKRTFIFFSIILLFSNHFSMAQDREDCIPPRTLYANIEIEDYPFYTDVYWDQPFEDWLYYDDGINIDAIGGPLTFSWAIKFDSIHLMDYEGAFVTKVRVFNITADVNTLQVFEGSNADTLLYEQELIGLDIDAWNEIELNTAVPIDITKELWITIYTTHGNNYLAACGRNMNEPNGDLITTDGISWEHLTDYNLPFTWNLGCFVTDAVGRVIELRAKPNDNVYSSEPKPLKISGIKKNSEPVRWISSEKCTREWIGYNLYKNGELILEEYPDNFYKDFDIQEHVIYCYEATSVYSICGESDATNEACDFIILGFQDHASTIAQLYPNPANDQITIEAKDINFISITNQLGQFVFKQQLNSVSKHTIHTSGFNPGMYIAKIYTEDNISVKKFLIRK